MSGRKKKWRNGDPSGPSGKCRMPQRTTPRLPEPIDPQKLAQMGYTVSAEERAELRDLYLATIRAPGISDRDRLNAGKHLLTMHRQDVEIALKLAGLDDKEGTVHITIIDKDEPSVCGPSPSTLMPISSPTAINGNETSTEPNNDTA